MACSQVIIPINVEINNESIKDYIKDFILDKNQVCFDMMYFIFSRTFECYDDLILDKFKSYINSKKEIILSKDLNNILKFINNCREKLEKLILLLQIKNNNSTSYKYLEMRFYNLIINELITTEEVENKIKKEFENNNYKILYKFNKLFTLLIHTSFLKINNDELGGVSLILWYRILINNLYEGIQSLITYDNSSLIKLYNFNKKFTYFVNIKKTFKIIEIDNLSQYQDKLKSCNDIINHIKTNLAEEFTNILKKVDDLKLLEEIILQYSNEINKIYDINEFIFTLNLENKFEGKSTTEVLDFLFKTIRMFYPKTTSLYLILIDYIKEKTNKVKDSIKEITDFIFLKINIFLPMVLCSKSKKFTNPIFFEEIYDATNNKDEFYFHFKHNLQNMVIYDYAKVNKFYFKIKKIIDVIFKEQNYKSVLLGILHTRKHNKNNDNLYLLDKNSWGDYYEKGYLDKNFLDIYKSTITTKINEISENLKIPIDKTINYNFHIGELETTITFENKKSAKVRMLPIHCYIIENINNYEKNLPYDKEYLSMLYKSLEQTKLVKDNSINENYDGPDYLDLIDNFKNILLSSDFTDKIIKKEIQFTRNEIISSNINQYLKIKEPDIGIGKDELFQVVKDNINVFELNESDFEYSFNKMKEKKYLTISDNRVIKLFY